MGTGSDHKRELKRAYKERPKPAGVFQIKNTTNGKVFLGSSLNLDGALNAHRFTLSLGSHRNRTLQDEWKQHGADAFAFEILEVVEVIDEPGFDLGDELRRLEEIWIERLQPVGERGYNETLNIRQA